MGATLLFYVLDFLPLDLMFGVRAHANVISTTALGRWSCAVRNPEPSALPRFLKRKERVKKE